MKVLANDPVVLVKDYRPAAAPAGSGVGLLCEVESSPLWSRLMETRVVQ